MTGSIRSAAPSLLCFGLDLRLDDHPALRAAVRRGAPLVPVFIWAPAAEDPWPPGAASRWWLHHSLDALAARLAARGSRLILRRGPKLQALQQLVAETGARAVFWNRRYEPAAAATDTAIEAALRAGGIAVETFPGATLFDPSTVFSQATHRPFQVFSAFWAACLRRPEPPPAQPAPRRLPAPGDWPASLELSDLDLLPHPDWAGGLRAAWRPGEAGAAAAWKSFLRRALREYAAQRDRPDRPGTSRLSPHLHFGEISPRRIWHALRKLRGADPAVDCYLKELGWREFAYHLLFHFPRTAQEPLRAQFARFPWRTDAGLIRAWQRGTTGYPIVDAGMRQLWSTGWMHNRVRMIAASFLTRQMRMNWLEGACWFWDTLVDADLANNTLGWQWSAGCGADAAPYFRIFNPLRQSRRFDPEGTYIRRWIPELSRLAPPWIYAPWTAPAPVLAAAGIELGRTYPFPVLDHERARREALAAFASLRRLARSGG